MPLAVLMPAGEVEGFPLDQRMAGVTAVFGQAESTSFFARPEDAGFYRARLPEVRIEPLRPGCLDRFDRIALMECSRPDLSPYGDGLAAASDARLYHVYDYGLVVPLGRAIDAVDYPFIDAHAFNRYSPRAGAVDFGCSYFFPYGYLYRLFGMGPINEYGHRIPFDFRALASRPTSHKVVACYGGSACWSVYCCHQQTFTQVMEQRLNDRCASRGLGLQFTVLNFGSPGQVVLNEIFTHVLFGSLVKPDVVVAHDGSNDIGYGQTSDPFLLRDHIVYQPLLETWSRLLHDPGYHDRLVAAPIETADRRTAGQLLRAYVARKRQFCDIARAGGSLVVSGLQPIFLSRREYSPLERRWLFDDPRVAIEQHAGFRNVLATYRLFLENRPALGEDLFVDLHGYFGEFGADCTLMADPVHAAPDGDRVIGEHYADLVLETFLPRWVGNG
jgi:hypothetical protein